MAAAIEKPAAIQIAVVMHELSHDSDDAHVTREPCVSRLRAGPLNQPARADSPAKRGKNSGHLALAGRGGAALPCAAMPQSSHAALPTAADVDAAAQRLAGVALRTPLVTSPVLDAATGARVFLKAEI